MTIRHLFIAATALAGASALTVPWLDDGDTVATPTLAESVASMHHSSFDELNIRNAIYYRVRALVEARDFAALNALEDEYRTTRARTASGTWKLSEFHGAVQAALPASERNHGCLFPSEPILSSWVAATPSAPTPYLASATMIIDRAWCHRGDDFATDVPPPEIQWFRANIRAAEAFLSAHKKIVGKDPEYFAIMEQIYQAQGRDRSEFQLLLDEGTSKEPYYYRLYWNAFDYNMPQWSGGYAEIADAARYAVERTRMKDGLGAYARYFWYASERPCRICLASSIDWNMMKQSMRDVAERYPDPCYLAKFAWFGCKFNDREVARHYFDALGDRDGPDAWLDKDSWDKCRAFAGLQPFS